MSKKKKEGRRRKRPTAPPASVAPQAGREAPKPAAPLPTRLERMAIGSRYVLCDPVLAAWLSDLIRAFQDEARRPAVVFGNLEDLSPPAQIVAFSVGLPDGSFLSEFAIVHYAQVANGATWALVFRSLEELADVASTADAAFGSPQRRVVRDDAEMKLERGPLAILAARLGARLRGRAGPLDPRQKQIEARERSAFSDLGGSSFWVVQFQHPLPLPELFLQELGGPPLSAASAQDQRPEGQEPRVPPTVPAEAVMAALGAFCDPAVWFGSDPFNLPRSEVLGHPPPVRGDPTLVFEGEVLGAPLRVYSNGLVLVVSRDRELARSGVNQFFAALDRSGVPATAASSHELISVNGFDASKRPSGTSGSMTHRNRSMSMERVFSPFIHDDVLVVDPVDVPRVAAAAHAAAGDRRLAEQSTRLLAGVTANHARQHTEAFIMFWTVIESVLQGMFESYWIGRGRSKTKAAEMVKDWPASHQIDALNAGAQLRDEVCAELHRLRKVRNAIVHDLREATSHDTRSCHQAALAIAGLPAADPPVSARRALVMS